MGADAVMSVLLTIELSSAVATIVTSVGEMAIVGSTLVFIGKLVISQQLARDLEKFGAEQVKALEEQRTELRRIGFEHETRFSRLHERRVEVVGELYKRLVKTERIIRRLGTPLRPPDISRSRLDQGKDIVMARMGGPGVNSERGEAHIQAVKAIAELEDYLSENRFWFAPTLSADLGRFSEQRWYAYSGVFALEVAEDREDGPKSWDDVKRFVLEDLPGFRRALEDDLRKMLGVEDTQP